MKDFKLFYELAYSKEGKEYYRIFVIVNGIKLYLQFTDYTSKRIFQEAIECN